MDTYFEVVSKLEVNIKTTKDYWDYIVEVKHPVMEGTEEKVKKILSDPDEIRRSAVDVNVYLYYKQIERLYCVVAKHTGDEGYLLTAYPTDRVKEGEIIWKR